MIIHLLDAHAGRHAADAAALLAVPQLFRRLFPGRRKAAPAVLSPAGAAALTTAQQQEHADAMHDMAKQYLPDVPRPVNGRSLGTLPRLTTPDRPPWHTAAFPVYGEAPVADVIAAEEQAKDDAARTWYRGETPGADILAIVAKRLREAL